MTLSATTEDGVAIAYDVQGQGPALVFVHGLGDRREVWSDVIGPLSDSFRCVALDLRGHGGSGRSTDYEAFGLSRDVLAVLDALALEGAVLVGHSLGGFVVSVAAAATPRVRAVVNVDQPLALAELGGAVRGMGRALHEEPVAELLMGLLAQLGLGSLSEAQLRQLRASRAELPREVVLGAWAPLLADDDAALEARIDRLLARVRCPYLSLHGCAIAANYPRWLAQRLPQAEREHWPDAGHFPHLCQPVELAQRLREWVTAMSSV